VQLILFLSLLATEISGSIRLYRFMESKDRLWLLVLLTHLS